MENFQEFVKSYSNKKFIKYEDIVLNDSVVKVDFSVFCDIISSSDDKFIIYNSEETQTNQICNNKNDILHLLDINDVESSLFSIAQLKVLEYEDFYQRNIGIFNKKQDTKYTLFYKSQGLFFNCQIRSDLSDCRNDDVDLFAILKNRIINDIDYYRAIADKRIEEKRVEFENYKKKIKELLSKDMEFYKNRNNRSVLAKQFAKTEQFTFYKLMSLFGYSTELQVVNECYSELTK